MLPRHFFVFAIFALVLLAVVTVRAEEAEEEGGADGNWVPAEYVIEHPPHKPIDSQGTPNSLGLRVQLDSRQFVTHSGTVRVRCIAHVGSRRYESERQVMLAHANNQRFSAGDPRNTANALYAATLPLLVALLLT